MPTRFRPHLIKSNAPAAVAAGDIGERIGNREPIAGLRAYDTGDLPVSYDLIKHAGRASAKLLAVAKRKLVDVAKHEAMPYIEVGVAVFEIGISLIAKIAVIERSQVRTGSVIHGVRVRVGGLKLQATGKVLLPAHLQGIVV